MAAATPEAHVFSDTQELAAEAADFFVWLAERAIAQRGRFIVALSGGSTPQALYQALTSTHSTSLEWSYVWFFFGDERCVPPSDPESNFRTAHDGLFQPLHISQERIFRLEGEKDPPAAAAAYEAIMRSVLDAPDGWPRFDLILLGLGHDGHTASLFPDTAALDVHQKWITPGFAPVGVRNRLSITLGVINHADVVLFLVTGSGKAAITREILECPSGSASRYPASLVHPAAGRLLWFLDSAAASELTTTKQHMAWREE
jgi:6-phosphogluconolactonase